MASWSAHAARMGSFAQSSTGLGWLIAMTLAMPVLLACAMRPERLPPVHRSYYRLIEDSDKRRAFLEMEPQARERFAKELGYASAWSALPPAHKRKVLQAQIDLGFDRFAVHMAWGRPADEKQMQARGRKLWLETYIQCTSGPKNRSFVFDHLECDGTSSETQVVFENDRVIELRALD